MLLIESNLQKSAPLQLSGGNVLGLLFGLNLDIPAFRVQAVTPGWYGGIYYQQGDVFDLFNGSDYSASNVNYQVNGNETVFGWMTRVPSSTMLFRAQAVQVPAPLFPVSFTGVRTVM